VGCILSHIRDLSGVKQSLSWNTSAVQAGSPELIPFDQGYRFAELSASQSRGVSATSAAQNDYVEVVLCHLNSNCLFAM
jgi:hypothetical protein